MNQLLCRSAVYVLTHEERMSYLSGLQRDLEELDLNRQAIEIARISTEVAIRLAHEADTFPRSAVVEMVEA